MIFGCKDEENTNKNNDRHGKINIFFFNNNDKELNIISYLTEKAKGNGFKDVVVTVLLYIWAWLLWAIRGEKKNYK